MKSEIIACDLCPAEEEAVRGISKNIKTYYLKFPSLYLAGYAFDQGKVVRLDLCSECAKQMSILVDIVKDAFEQTLSKKESQQEATQ